MNEYDFYSHKKLTDRLYVVYENYGNDENLICIYVVIGDEKVGVIDTGLACTTVLRKYIEKNIIDRKPMIAYMTHGDLDHLGGSVLFDDAYLNERDWNKLDWQLNVERRFSDLYDTFSAKNQAVVDFCRDKYLHNENATFKNIDEGDVIDLGGVSLEVIALPGHSAGSIGYYNEKEGYMLVGDGASPYNAWQRCTDLQKSIDYYSALLERLPADTKFYNGHTPHEIPRSLIEDMIQGKAFLKKTNLFLSRKRRVLREQYQHTAQSIDFNIDRNRSEVDPLLPAADFGE